MLPRHADSAPKRVPRHEGEASAKGAVLRSTFFSGVAVLTLSTVLVKIIGLFYKIPMLRYLGSVGMGYFNAAYEWYAMLCVLSTAGLPIAVSMLIARERTSADRTGRRCDAIRRIERCAMRIFLVLGVVGSLLLFFGAGALASLIDSPLTAAALCAVAPTLLFSCISAGYRGYYQGFQNMVPTAVSQLIEAIGKLVLGLLFAHLAARVGAPPHVIAAYAMLGLSLGVGVSCLYLWLYRMRHCPERSLPSATSPQSSDGGGVRIVRRHATVRQLLSIALPVTLSSSVLSLTRIVDMTMILRCLQHIGYSTEQANSLYGIYTTMAIPIFNLVPALLTAVSLSLIPTLSAQMASGDRSAQQHTVQTALRLTALFSIPASLALTVYSRPILALLFGASESELSTAAPMLSLLSLSVLFSGLITTTNAALQAFGYPRVPIASMLAGAFVKLIGAALLISQPAIHIMGAPLSTLLCNSLIVGINLLVMYRRTGADIDIRRTLLYPLLVSLPSVGLPAALCAYLIGRGCSEIAMFVTAVPLTLALFLVLSLVSGMLCEEVSRFLPAAKRTSSRLRLGRCLPSEKH